MCAEWREEQAMKLKGMLEASIQRRFPKGLKVRVRSAEKSDCLRDLAQRLRAANLSITRAKVATFALLLLECIASGKLAPFPVILEHPVIACL